MNKTRELAANIVDMFDDLLYEKGISIPCEDSSEESERYADGNSNEAMLYGTEFWNLVDKIEAVLRKYKES